MKALHQHLLHAIDEVLARPEVSKTQRQEAVSLKKLLKGDGSWGTRKVILGWVVDTVRQTIELPAHRKAELAEIFEGLKGLKRMGHNAGNAHWASSVSSPQPSLGPLACSVPCSSR